ncbi:hypothetical protein GOP47_0005929 [Adiantum capillus-veneris]|uniref:Uncharacterized protein n=1 Tax=Adiantum capillus-veneris TaxID=13818 RepID=A0A9D4V2V3_ADICA|nr:hypothetical protein GOP47_0005929 [Adiantum capillus-veneris]
MDGSLASIFLNPVLAQRHCDNEWTSLDSQCPEELQYKLACASMELQRTKAAAKEEEQIQDAKLHHLQELLSIIRKERDEAREECQKLRECISQQSSSCADSPCSFMNSSPIMSSPTSSPWSLQQLEEHLNSDSFCDFGKVPASLELQQTLQSFSQSCNDEHGFQALFPTIQPTCESILESSLSPFSLDVLEQASPFEAEPSLHLAELEQSKEAMQVMSESSQSTRSLSRQSSSNSSSASVQIFQQAQSFIDLTDSGAPSSSVEKNFVEPGAECYMIPSSPLCDNASLPVVSSCTSSKVLPLTRDSPTNSISASVSITNLTIGAEGVPAMKSTLLTTQACRAQSPPNVPLAAKQAIAPLVRQVHLPEPPEADPQVMLSSLPEKGKLLQAVMQAGPLLQTLLLAGPLPQWRHPPPPLSTGDIPKVSMVPSMVPYPNPCVAQGHIKYVTPTINCVPASATRVRAANADSCARPKKLRKLSPATPHQSQLMHMWSSDGRMPVGVVSYPPTIY